MSEKGLGREAVWRSDWGWEGGGMGSGGCAGSLDAEKSVGMESFHFDVVDVLGGGILRCRFGIGSIQSYPAVRSYSPSEMPIPI